MDIFEVIKTRRSIRRFLDKPVEEEKLRNLLNIPSNIRIVGLFPIGYPREEKKEVPSRKPLNEIVFYEQW